MAPADRTAKVVYPRGAMATYDLYLYIDGVPTVDQVGGALGEFAVRWDGQMGWWITEAGDRGSGVRLRLIVEPHLGELAPRLDYPAMAVVALTTDDQRSDRDFVTELNTAATLQRTLGGTLYDPQVDTLFATADAFDDHTRRRVVAYFNQRDRFEAEITGATATRAALVGGGWAPDDEAVDILVAEHRPWIVAASISLALLALFVAIAVHRACGG